MCKVLSTNFSLMSHVYIYIYIRNVKKVSNFIHYIYYHGGTDLEPRGDVVAAMAPPPEKKKSFFSLKFVKRNILGLFLLSTTYG
jgi:hypothetical protein